MDPGELEIDIDSIRLQQPPPAAPAPAAASFASSSTAPAGSVISASVLRRGSGPLARATRKSPSLRRSTESRRLARHRRCRLGGGICHIGGKRLG